MKRGVVTVYSRKDFEDVAYLDKNRAAISITDPDSPRPFELDGWAALLEVEFYDVPDSGWGSLTPIEQEHADRIVDFIAENLHRDFAIHCEAGASRSVAVGRFMHMLLGFSLKQVHKGNYGNQYVLRCLTDSFRRRFISLPADPTQKG